jgi:hypothetical protein
LIIKTSNKLRGGTVNHALSILHFTAGGYPSDHFFNMSFLAGYSSDSLVDMLFSGCTAIADGVYDPWPVSLLTLVVACFYQLTVPTLAFVKILIFVKKAILLKFTAPTALVTSEILS